MMTYSLKGRSLVLAAAMLVAPALACAQDPAQDDAAKGLALQKRHFLNIEERGKKVWYDNKFDLSGMPHYVPDQKVSGKLRIWGTNYIGTGKLAEYWEQAFRKYNPEVTFEFFLPTAVVAFPGLYLGLADIAMDHKPGFYDLLGYERVTKRHPLEITVVTGSYNVPGWDNSTAILVNKNNPIAHISMHQLDQVFGAARNGGWVGTNWHTEFSRGETENIRTWGQLGATGEWADKPIHTYGFSLRYNTSTDFSDWVLQGSDKWNENIQVFGNYLKPDGTTYAEADQILDHVTADPYAIAYLNYKTDNEGTKRLSVSVKDGGPYVTQTIETVQNRTYPLFHQQYFYVDKKPGEPLDPKVKEFLRFVLSQEGQDAIQRDGKYLPLTAEIVREQLRKLD